MNHDDKKYVKYYNDIVQYTAPKQVTSNCACITFVNDGTATMLINGYPLAAGVGVSFAGNDWEMDVTHYNITFLGAGTTVCSVFRKVYTD